MSLSRDLFSNNVMRLLCEKADSDGREDRIDVEKCYLDYTDDEKERFKSYRNFKNLAAAPGEVALWFKNRDGDFYILASARAGWTMSSEDFEEIDCSLAELAILDDAGLLSVSHGVSPSVIHNRLMIYDGPKYTGNTYDDICSFFEQLQLFKADSGLAIKADDPYCLYSLYLLQSENDKYRQFSSDTKAAISEVVFSGLMIPYANVALALNSKQWEHVFLESYRIIEHTFPVIFMKKLSKTGLTKSPMVVAKVLEEVISWRPPEEESLRLIFEEIIMRPEFQPIITFLSSSMSVAKEDLYRWYYKSVRNQIVHYRSIHIKLSFSDEQWDALIGLNFQIIKYLYKKYSRQIGAIDKTS